MYVEHLLCARFCATGCASVMSETSKRPYLTEPTFCWRSVSKIPESVYEPIRGQKDYIVTGRAYFMWSTVFPRQSQKYYKIHTFSKNGNLFAWVRLKISIANVTNTGLLHSFDLQNRFDISKQTNKKTCLGKRSLTLSLIHVPLGDSTYSSMTWILGYAWSLSSKQCKIDIYLGQIMKLFVPEMLAMKFTSLKTILIRLQITFISKYLITVLSLRHRGLSMLQNIRVHLHL